MLGMVERRWLWLIRLRRGAGGCVALCFEREYNGIWSESASSVAGDSISGDEFLGNTALDREVGLSPSATAALR